MVARHPRIPCVVPFCRCGATSYPPGYEIICPKHYRLVDAGLKAARRRAKRLLVKRGEWIGGAEDRPVTERAARIMGRFWARMVRQAVERSAGASA